MGSKLNLTFKISLVTTLLEPIQANVASYITDYRIHIETEERDLIPLADLLLNRKDWAGMAAEFPIAESTAAKQ